MIFARQVSDPLASLVKKIDKATADNADYDMGSFIVFLGDDETLEGKLKEFAKKQNLAKMVVCLDNVAGPADYNIAKEADVTVILYTRQEVIANHAFRKGELDNAAIERIVGNIKKILE